VIYSTYESDHHEPNKYQFDTFHMPKEQKTKIFEHFFNQRWDPTTRSLSNPVVTIAEVGVAITALSTLKPDNPANFLKDYQRKRGSANRKWAGTPMFAAGYTVVQRTGTGDCFEFVKLQSGQTDPFPMLGNWKSAETLEIQSLSIPLASKSLGRTDETWLTQVA